MANRKKKEPETWADAVMAGVESINESLARGQALQRRHASRVAAPRVYNPRLIRETRAKFDASQDIFATFFGAKTVTVQMWEQGRRRPGPTARRLMDLMNQDPEYFRRQFGQAVRVA